VRPSELRLGARAHRHGPEAGRRRRRGPLRQRLAPILENPRGTFDDDLGGIATKVFTGRIKGHDVAMHVYKEGKYQGQIGVVVVPRGGQRAKWGF
jgi:hypothetical protein